MIHPFCLIFLSEDNGDKLESAHTIFPKFWARIYCEIRLRGQKKICRFVHLKYNFHWRFKAVFRFPVFIGHKIICFGQKTSKITSIKSEIKIPTLQ
jgi:hypothetical protein